MSIADKMAIFAKVAEQWHVSQTGEVKFCVLGLTSKSIFYLFFKSKSTFNSR
jgi:hypothetical protein